MINGFSGMAAAGFIRRTNQAMTQAAAIHSRNPFEGHKPANIVTHRIFDDGSTTPVTFNMPVPRVQPVRDLRLRFSPEDALRENINNRTGVGNSTNIVVNRDIFENTLRRIDAADDQAGECIFRTCQAIESICRDLFIVPETNPRIMNLTGKLKTSLGQFRSITEETNISTRSFVNRVIEADQWGS